MGGGGSVNIIFNKNWPATEGINHKKSIKTLVQSTVGALLY